MFDRRVNIHFGSASLNGGHPRRVSRWLAGLAEVIHVGTHRVAASIAAHRAHALPFEFFSPAYEKRPGSEREGAEKWGLPERRPRSQTRLGYLVRARFAEQRQSRVAP
ncbi:hypothetical protein HPB47_010826 [Ixodes persulcatus]|uniref:Uncharacterized protein n=1 Tax=Ixodes persulcatus TaxID=34615 RepID=A0AC60NXZ6_IXOPE|nr:hypothetical protein HPB47_010826 [Ixodes persulcatus]